MEIQRIKNKDISRACKIIHVSDRLPLQTILYAVVDVLGDRIYYTQEAERYIKDSRMRKSKIKGR